MWATLGVVVFILVLIVRDQMDDATRKITVADVLSGWAMWVLIALYMVGGLAIAVTLGMMLAKAARWAWT